MSIYAVNGKEPIAAWIPSLDTSGNGTTTVSDLVGSNDGTLTNMDAPTDWVTDTASGGTTAIETDGVNDYVQAGLIWTAPTALTVAGWFKMSSVSTSEQRLFATNNNLSTSYPYVVFRMNVGGVSGQLQTLVYDGSDVTHQAYTIADETNWFHVAVTAVEGSYRKTYVNGVLRATDSVFGNFASVATGVNTIIGANRGANATFAAMRWDDIRAWGVALDDTDISYLYSANDGRGITPVTANPTAIMQINNQSMRVGL